MNEGGKIDIDVLERSVPRGGAKQEMNERLFMQLLVFTGCRNAGPVVEAVKSADLPCVVYRDVNDPRGLGLLTWSVDPAHFATTVRDLANSGSLGELEHRPEMAMVGRSYAIGYEPDLRDWIIERPRRNVLNRELPWAVWYPLRRTGAFAQLAADEQRSILAEHGRIGKAYGEAGLAHDVRLACHGLDVNDNEFVIGLLGSDLHPLSHVVETMRKTRQTSEYIQKMGPFFVGHALWQSALPATPV